MSQHDVIQERDPSERDHRRLGRRLAYFDTDELIGRGLPMWLPVGAAVRRALEDFVVEIERKAGFQHVYTPPLGKRELYETSGHWQHFADDMFPPLSMDGEELVLRPMNCPHHIRVYGASEHSHRELPVRIAEFGAMFRNERSGVIGGLSRVRAMNLNDGHVFCTPEQLGGEIDLALSMIGDAYARLGIEVHRFRLSQRGAGAKYVDDPDMWAQSEAVLEQVLVARGIEFEREEGEAAFYGPKIDVQVVDHAGREETLSTVQVDFFLPRRFGITYVASDGSRPHPILVHRSVTATVERMVAHLLEVHDGWLPLWLAPVQVAIAPVSEASEEYGEEVARLLGDAGIRHVVMAHDDTLGNRVRRAASSRIPLVVVVGEQEAAARAVSVRDRHGNVERRSLSEFVADLARRNQARQRG